MDLRSFCHSAGQPVHTQGSHLPVPSDALDWSIKNGQTTNNFGRTQIDPETLDPIRDPRDVTKRWMWGDDLTIDEDAGLAYVAAH